MMVFLLQYRGERNTLNKNITLPANGFDCRLLDEVSVSEPVIEIATNSNSGMVGANYACIPELGRWYWVTDIRYNRNGVYTVSLKCDVLYTYFEAITNSYGILRRCASLSTPELLDEFTAISNETTTSSIPFTPDTSGFSSPGSVILLTTGPGAGGSSAPSEVEISGEAAVHNTQSTPLFIKVVT